MNTYFRTDSRGSKCAETNIDLAGTKFTLKINTSKRFNGKLVTMASVFIRRENFETHRMCTDYLKTIVSEKVRVTEKAVERQHMLALAMLETIKDEVKNHYTSPEHIADYGVEYPV